jgi:hypothetical protein
MDVLPERSRRCEGWARQRSRTPYFLSKPMAICRACGTVRPASGHFSNEPGSQRQTNPMAICRGYAAPRSTTPRRQTNPMVGCRGYAGHRSTIRRHQTNPMVSCRGYAGHRSTTPGSPNEPNGRHGRAAASGSSTRRDQPRAFPERTQPGPGVRRGVPRTNPPPGAPNESTVPFRSVDGSTGSGVKF